jgi:L-seryl-tRNA(Ser) seleniumtransferase
VDGEIRNRLRRIPSIDRLLLCPDGAALLQRFPREWVADALRAAVEARRAALRAGEGNGHDGADAASLWRDAAERLAVMARPSLRPAINATGVVLHTGLGRAVLAEAAIRAVTAVARQHSLLEIDPESGERGSRQEHVRGLLCRLTGAEEALVVNNNAAAVLLAIATLAAGREVVISRGQLVEIGGSFRIPDVIRQSGARLVEVGATNKTRAADYRAAFSGETAMLLRVHPSNFRMVGFTEEVPLDALVALAREHGFPLMDDLGSGALIDMTRYGLTAEPTVQESVAAGADVVTFSGDKLLGGPQCGLIVGRQACLAPMARHPLMRAVRCDKMTLAALEATLRLYLDEPTALQEIPTLRALVASPELLRARAERLSAAAREAGAEVALEEGISQVGGGSLPGEELPVTLVCLRPAGFSAEAAARALRLGDPPIFCRIRRDALVFDLRTVTDAELEAVIAAIQQLRENDASHGDGPLRRLSVQGQLA